jgi:hypothetical protein
MAMVLWTHNVTGVAMSLVGWLFLAIAIAAIYRDVLPHRAWLRVHPQRARLAVIVLLATAYVLTANPVAAYYLPDTDCPFWKWMLGLCS